jgi:hypothetical protein
VAVFRLLDKFSGVAEEVDAEGDSGDSKYTYVSESAGRSGDNINAVIVGKF